jgi:ribose transport system permease protein
VPPERTETANVSIQDVVGIQQTTFLERLTASQPFWITVALFAIIVFMSFYEPAYATERNFYNITRNFAFIGIMAMGMLAVIITGGIDLSVGSIMGFVSIVAGVILEAHYPWWVALPAGLLAGAALGAINGYIIAYVGLPPFVVTLGMLAAARSFAQILSGNRMITDFGPDKQIVLEIGGGQILGIANPVWILVILTFIFGFVFNYTSWGRRLFAIGGNEQAAQLTGVPVRRMKFQVYVLSACMAALSSILILGWQGSAINALGIGYELRVIASTVIGGADLMGEPAPPMAPSSVRPSSRSSATAC